VTSMKNGRNSQLCRKVETLVATLGPGYSFTFRCYFPLLAGSGGMGVGSL
jgi:hypothetical protein